MTPRNAQYEQVEALSKNIVSLKSICSDLSPYLDYVDSIRVW